MTGAAVTTSSINVGARCPYARAGAGAVLTQYRTDQRLGLRGLALLEQGLPAPEVIRTLTGGDPDIDWRQLAVVDRNGTTGVFNGSRVASVRAAAEGAQCCAIGNILRSERVPSAMVAAFESAADSHLAERLLLALEAGQAAGGEQRQIKSAALLVVAEQAFPLVDLRVEFDRSPLRQLRFLWEIYAPQTDHYVRQALDPASLG